MPSSRLSMTTSTSGTRSRTMSSPFGRSFSTARRSASSGVEASPAARWRATSRARAVEGGVVMKTRRWARAAAWHQGGVDRRVSWVFAC